MSSYNARFPEKYRRGLFTFDWSYGIIYYIGLQPEGSSYSAKAEEFISGAPLPLTDGAIGPDGAMYFLTGGRRIESHLYRVYYGDNKLGNDPLPSKESDQVVEARKIRSQLESFQEKPDPTAINTAWPYLKSNDRFIRYAARIALEHQPVKEWQEKALAEKDPIALTQAMIALARNGDSTLQSRMLDSLMTINYNQLNEQQQIDLLRAFEVTLSRMGNPGEGEGKQLSAYLDPKYPASSNELNRELSKILVFIGDPHVVSKTLSYIDNVKDDDSVQKTATQSSDLILRNLQYGVDVANMLANRPPEQKIYLAVALSTAKNGWTSSLRDKYFKLFPDFLKRKGGNSYIGYIIEARNLALGNVPKNEFNHYDNISGKSLIAQNERGRPGLADAGRAKGPGRAWKIDEAVQVVASDSGKLDYSRGKTLFTVSMCSSCHKMGGEGGSIGPDLTQLGTRFSSKDILESIIDPSKVISDQYAATKFVLKDGSTIIGRLIRQDSDKYYVSQNPFAPLELREVLKSNVVSNSLSNTSIMPPGLIYPLNPQELKDLMAYLMSGGDKNNKIYKKK
jgi:putative heme-binding domain-containing protein